MNKQMMKRIVLGAIVVLVGIQLIPVWLVQTNPPVQAEPAWDSPRTRTLLQRACFDCHSNETTWPLYSRVAPVSWLVTLDTIRGRGHLNFSEWGTSGQGRERVRSANDMVEVISNGSMPPSNYLILHPDAKLTAAERQDLINGLRATFK